MTYVVLAFVSMALLLAVVALIKERRLRLALQDILKRVRKIAIGEVRKKNEKHMQLARHSRVINYDGNENLDTRSLQMVPTGLNLRPENLALLDMGVVPAVELTFDRIDDPLRIEPYLANYDPAHVSVHALKLSVASSDRPPTSYLDRLRGIARENGATAVSDHLGFTCAGRHELAHFCPPPFTRRALDATCRNIDYIQSYLANVDFFIENIAYQIVLDGEMDEAEFLCRVLERTHCGWLMDVHNVIANSRNHGYDAKAFVRQVVPFTSRIEVHLAGGFTDRSTGVYVDSHSQPISEETWDLFRYAMAISGSKVQSVFIERDSNFPSESEWLRELRTAMAIANRPPEDSKHDQREWQLCG